MPLPPDRLQPPLFSGTQKLNKGRTLNAKFQSGNTGFDDVTRDGGMDQWINLSTKSIIIATVAMFWDIILLMID